MHNIVYALTFSSTNIACLSSLTAGRKDRKPPSGYTVGLGSSSHVLVRLLYSREPSQSGPE